MRITKSYVISLQIDEIIIISYFRIADYLFARYLFLLFIMAKTSLIARAMRAAKFGTREKNRCFRCGRGRGYMRDFGTCRICFRELANEGKIPGVRKSSW